MTDKKITDFLIRAKQATYAGKGAETAPSREKSHDLIYEAAVDLVYYLIDTGKKSLEKIDGPLFKSFCHDGVVRIAAGAGSDIQGLIP